MLSKQCLDSAYWAAPEFMIINQSCLNHYLPEQLDITLRDLNSTNGTFVNNLPVKEKAVKHGDLIRICNYEYRLFDDQSHVGTQTEYCVSDE